MLTAEVEVDFSEFDAALDKLAEGLNECDSPPMSDAFNSASDLYWNAAQARYGRFSEHLGDWADHALSTKKKKFYESGGRAAKGLGRTADFIAYLQFPLLFSIINGGRLYNAYSPGGADHIRQNLPDGIADWIAVDYAIYHQEGTSRMPARMTLVPIEDSTLGSDLPQEITSTIAGGVASLANSVGFEAEII
jgi:hypothetical protein